MTQEILRVRLALHHRTPSRTPGLLSRHSLSLTQLFSIYTHSLSLAVMLVCLQVGQHILLFALNAEAHLLACFFRKPSGMVLRTKRVCVCKAGWPDGLFSGHMAKCAHAQRTLGWPHGQMGSCPAYPKVATGQNGLMPSRS